MQTLPNIFPTANADSFNDGGAMTFPGPPEKSNEPFDDLMTRALSPASNEANRTVEPSQTIKNAAPDSEKFGVQTDTNNAPQQIKNSKSSTQISGKIPVKKSGGDSSARANTPAFSETNVVATNPEDTLIPIVVLTTAPTDQTIGLNAKTAPDVSVAGSKATIAGKSAEILATLPEEKKFSMANTPFSNAVVSQNHSDIEPNPVAKADGEEKIAAAAEALTVEKINSTDSKTAKPTATNPQVLPLNKNVVDDLTAPKIAIQSFTQSPQPELSASRDLNAKSATSENPGFNGTTVAQQDVPMNKTEKTDKITVSGGKILPGAAVSSSQTNPLPPRENFSTLAMRAGQIVTTDSASSSGRVTETAQLSADSANSIVSASVADVRLRGLERVQDMVVLHAARLSDSGNSLLQVVIKPGAGTQLSLELRQRGDGVEAQAVLQRGDFEHLKQQWPALQQQLEQRGIRLAPLVADGNFAGNGENNFQQKQNQSAELDSFPAFAEVAPVSFAQPAARAGAHLGWESWA